MQDSNVQ